MLFKSKVPDVMLQAEIEDRRAIEENRKEQNNIKMSIYYDNWESILYDLMQAQFTEKNFKKMKFSFNTSQNMLKKVINDISTVYKDTPQRKTDDENTSGLYNQILKNANINTIMKEVNSLFNLLNDIAIQPQWDPERQTIKLNIITPAKMSVIQDPDDPEKAIAVYYEVEMQDTFTDNRKYYVYWDSKNHYLFDSEGNKLAPEDNPDMKNPYGFIPFIFIHKKKIPGQFWNSTTGNDLVNGTTINGINKTLKNYTFKAQSFKQLWMRLQDKENGPDAAQYSDPSSMFILDDPDSEMGVLDIMPDFDKIDNALKEDINGFLSTYGLSVDAFSGTEISGVALKIKNNALTEIRQDQVDFFRSAENELFEMIRVIYNKEIGSDQINKNAEFSIDFPEIVYDEDQQEKRTLALSDLKTGLISPAEYYMRFNPDVTDPTEAEKRLNENLEKTKEMNTLLFNVNDEIEEE